LTAATQTVTKVQTFKGKKERKGLPRIIGSQEPLEEESGCLSGNKGIPFDAMREKGGDRLGLESSGKRVD